MSTLRIECSVFDPIRITTATTVDRFIIDTWFSTGLISQSLVQRLPGVGTFGTRELPLSSGMTVTRPVARVGLQIRNIRALPVELVVVDDGPSDLLLGAEFIARLFEISGRPIGSAGPPDSGPGGISVEPPEKYDAGSVGIRLIPGNDTVDALQLECFLGAVRTIHNVGVIANTGLHQHGDWPRNEPGAKTTAVRETITNDRSLYGEGTLSISWVETGSVWLSLKSGTKSALSWLSQIFEKSTDARLRSLLANAATAEEEAAIKHMTREDVATAKSWEQKRFTAKQIREAREEWRKTVLGEVDFRRKLSEKIQDSEVREVALEQMDHAIHDLLCSDFMPLIEHLPTISEEERDRLPVKRHNSDNDDNKNSKRRG